MFEENDVVVLEDLVRRDRGHGNVDGELSFVTS